MADRGRKRRRSQTKRSQELDRRTFLKKTAGGMAAATVLGACGTTDVDGENGSIEVHVSGLTGTDSGSITGTIPDSGDPAAIEVDLPAPIDGVSIGNTGRIVPPGTYRLTYDAPDGHFITDDEDFVDVTLSPGETELVEFHVQVAAAGLGTIEVTVTGYGASAADPGTVAITNPDGSPSGAAGITLGTPSAGQSTGSASNHPLGPFRVSFTPPAGHIMTSESFVDVTVEANATAQAAFTIQQQAPAMGLIFASDFSLGGLGGAQLALTDGDRWNVTGGAAVNRGLEVISSAGLDYPSTNVLRHTATASSSGFARITVNGLGDIIVGGQRCYRVYVRLAMPDSVDDRWHPIEDGDIGGSAVRAFRCVTSGAGQWALDLRIASGNIWLCTTPLSKNVTYRVEWRFDRISATTMRMHARVYNSANVLLFDDDDFSNGSTTLATNPIIPLDTPESLRAFRAGSNGIVASTYPFIAMYQGCFAISDADWCGPYVAGEGP